MLCGGSLFAQNFLRGGKSLFESSVLAFAATAAAGQCFPGLLGDSLAAAPSFFMYGSVI